MNYRIGCRLSLALIAGSMAGSLAYGQDLKVRVQAGWSGISHAPITVVVPAAQAPVERELRAGDTLCQVDTLNLDRSAVTFIAEDIKPLESREYRLIRSASQKSGGVDFQKVKDNLDIYIKGRLFSRYDTTTGPNKPYFYPLIGPTGESIVRHWPMREVTGETRDHPHHRGLWFTHGLVNGIDFWTEGEKAGKTVHKKYERIQDGPVYGHFRAQTDWLSPGGEKIAEDVRDVRVYPPSGGSGNILMDFDITLKPVGGPLTLGDTKEGSFGLRVPDSMRVSGEKDKVQGRILNSKGKTDTATWGQSAEWVDYSGPVEGETVGIAILDHRANPRHPTTWHVRDYGLFAVNPFGLHDFDPAKKDDPHAGDMLIPADKTVRFRYRLYFHRGNAEQVRIPAVWDVYTAPLNIQIITLP